MNGIYSEKRTWIEAVLIPAAGSLLVYLKWKLVQVADNITIIKDACVFFDLSNTYVWLARFFTTVKHLVFGKLGKVNLGTSANRSNH